MVLTVTLASIKDCHFRTRDLSLSDVKSRPWKLVKQFFPWTSSTRSLTFRKAWSSSFWRSAKETSKILPFKASFAFLRPVVLLTRVFPTLRDILDSCNYIDGSCVSYSLIWKEDGAYCTVSRCRNLSSSTNAHTLTWYQSLRVKGS